MSVRRWVCESCEKPSAAKPRECPGCHEETCEGCFDRFAHCKRCADGKTDDELRTAANANGWEFEADTESMELPAPKTMEEPTLSQLIDGLRLEWVDEFANVECDGEIHSVHLQSDAATPLGDYRVIGNDCYVNIGENRWRQIAAGESRDNTKMLGELDYKQRVRAIFKGV